MAKTLNKTKQPIPVFESSSGMVLGVLLNEHGEPLMLSEADLAEIGQGCDAEDDPNEPPF